MTSGRDEHPGEDVLVATVHFLTAVGVRDGARGGVAGETLGEAFGVDKSTAREWAQQSDRIETVWGVRPSNKRPRKSFLPSDHPHASSPDPETKRPRTR